jgi:hypothetical protein
LRLCQPFPPTQQIKDILDYFNASITEGTLLGYSPINSPSKRLKALRNMIESASDLIKASDYAQAIDQLEQMAFQNLRTLSWVMSQLC